MNIETGLEEYVEKSETQSSDFGHPGVGSRFAGLMRPPSEDSSGSDMRFPYAPPSEQAARVEEIILQARDLFFQKNRGYGDTAQFLGAKGQFADMNRKFWKLYGMLWTETIPMYFDRGEGEDVEEVLMDFIGHCALTIDFLRQEQGTKEEGQA